MGVQVSHKRPSSLNKVGLLRPCLLTSASPEEVLRKSLGVNVASATHISGLLGLMGTLTAK